MQGMCNSYFSFLFMFVLPLNYVKLLIHHFVVNDFDVILSEILDKNNVCKAKRKQLIVNLLKVLELMI